MVAWLENLATAVFTLFALVLFVIAARAWLYARSRRVMLLAGAFLLLFVKGIVLSVALFMPVPWAQTVVVPGILLDLGVLTLFYVAVLRRSS